MRCDEGSSIALIIYYMLIIMADHPVCLLVLRYIDRHKD